MASAETTAPSSWDGTASSAMAVSTVYRCVKVLSEAVASLPLACLRMDNNGIFRRQYSYDKALAISPMPGMSAFDFWSAAVSDLLLRGNAFILPRRALDAERPLIGLHLCRTASVAYDWQCETYTIRGEGADIDGVYSADEIVHLRINTSADHHRGVGVIAHAAAVVNLSHAGDTEAYNRIATGGNVRGLLTYAGPGSLRGTGHDQDKELNRYAEAMSRKIKVNGINAVAGDVKFQQFSLSSTDLQFLETRKFAVRDICRFFGVHPSFVFDDAAGNYKSAENANAAFLSTALNPLLCRIEAELRAKLAPLGYEAFYRFEFDRRKVHAIDADTHIKWQRSAIETGLMTINEMRKAENMEAVEGGDTPLISANLRPINEITTPQE